MSLTIETTHNAPVESLNLHCQTCLKAMKSEVFDFSGKSDTELLLYTGLAELHLKKHPKHTLALYQKRKLPENDELRTG